MTDVPRAEYPPDLARAGVAGDVVFHIGIRRDGALHALKVVRSAHPVLDELATNALRRARFSPAKIGDVPVDAYVRYTPRWALDEPSASSMPAVAE